MQVPHIYNDNADITVVISSIKVNDTTCNHVLLSTNMLWWKW